MVEVPIDEEWNSKTVQLWKLRSCYEGIHASEAGIPEYWHLHPELVDNTSDPTCETVLICPSCLASLKKNSIPKNSIASGIDFGYYKRLGLSYPSLMEQVIISRLRLFFGTFKVSSNSSGVVNADIKSMFRCHAILFPHDAPTVASYMFNPHIFETDGNNYFFYHTSYFLWELVSTFMKDMN